MLQVKPSFNGAPKPILSQVAPIYSYQAPRAAPPSRPAPLQTFAAPTAPIEHIIPVTHALPSPKTPTACFKPLSPLPALQTAPQYANSYSSSSPASSATYSAHSPRGWQHVQPSHGSQARNQSTQFNQFSQGHQGHQNQVYQQSPPAFDRQASAPAHYHQQVRSWVSRCGGRSWWIFWICYRTWWSFYMNYFFNILCGGFCLSKIIFGRWKLIEVMDLVTDLLVYTILKLFFDIILFKKKIIEIWSQGYASFKKCSKNRHLNH